MRVLVTSTSGRGHFQPLASLIDAFSQRGDEVLVVVPPSLATALPRAEVTLRPSAEPTREDSRRLWTKFSSLPRRDASRLVEREWFAELCLEAMLAPVEAAIEDWSPDLVVRESCEYAAALAADVRGIPLAQVGVSTAGAEFSVLTSLVRRHLEARRDGLTDRLLRAPYLTRFPASLDPSPFPNTIRYRELDQRSPQAIIDWWPGNDAPLVYLTFGTVATGRARTRTLLGTVLESIEDLGVRVLVTTGTAMAPEELGATPVNVHVESWVDQDDVFAVASLVVCHGGSGTTLGALAAGVPLVVVPLFADQPTNATLVRDAGAGIAVLDGADSSDVNVANFEHNLERLRGAVEEVLTQPRYRVAARRLADEIESADSPREAAERLALSVECH